MAGMHSLDGVGAADHAASDLDTNYEDKNSGNVFGISSEWADADGNLKSSNGGGTGQQGHMFGEALNINEVAEAAKAMGMSEQDINNFVDKFIADESNFNPGQSNDQKRVGAAVALNEMIAAENINHLGLGEDELRKVAGDAMEFANSGDAQGLRSALEGAGGNTGDMTDQQLLNVWTSNAHGNNHAIMAGDASQLTHLRSISKDDAADGSGGDKVGYMNDKQDWTQWDGPQDANRFLQANPLFA